jgi:hypothetical protein
MRRIDLVLAIELVVLVGLCVVAVMTFAPAHITSIWMHEEFSGWVAPIANRLGGGTLYTDGLHWPMPPLPAVLMHLGGHATWLTESRLFAIAQCATLLVGWATLSMALPRPAAFVATLVTMPIFFALKKALFYDALAQLWVALALFVGMVHFKCKEERITPIALGVICALALFTKQSTALGLFAGTMVVVFLERRRSALVVLAAFAIALAMLLVACSPMMSLPGFVVDVLLTGSQPKGGVLVLVRNLGAYAAQLLFSIAVLWLLATFVRAKKKELEVSIPILLASDIGSVYFMLLRCGLFLVVQSDRIVEVFQDRAVTRVAWVAFAAAVGHSLSVPQFRWAEDNNPLVLFAIAAIVMAVFWFEKRILRAAAFAFVFLLVLRGSGLGERVTLAQSCTVAWPDVDHLAGARLMPSSGGMHELVAEIRRDTKLAEEVLLLPDDPNVASWLDRPRPKLTSAIVFVDQYWDRFVDEDFRRIRERPPAVIVLGPRNTWRGFFAIWDHPGWGAERLIDRVERELLPEQYELRASIRIAMDWPDKGREDFMDVYVHR